MNTKNLIIWVLAAVILVGGGFMVYAAYQPPSPAPATTVDTSSSQTPPGSDQSQSGVPVVVTDSNNVFTSNATALVTGKVTPEGAQTSYWYDYGTSEALGTRSTLQAVGSGWVQIPLPPTSPVSRPTPRTSSAWARKTLMER